MKMYSISLTLLMSFTLAGCQFYQNRFNNPLKEADTYMLVTPISGGQCYTRIIDGFPQDQVCQKNDFLRYTAEPEVPKFADHIPPHVVVLFEAHGQVSYGQKLISDLQNKFDY